MIGKIRENMKGRDLGNRIADSEEQEFSDGAMG